MKRLFSKNIGTLGVYWRTAGGLLLLAAGAAALADDEPWPGWAMAGTGILLLAEAQSGFSPLRAFGRLRRCFAVDAYRRILSLT